MINTKVESINDQVVIISVNGERKEIEGVDQVVLAVGAEPDNKLMHELSNKILEVYVIGDAYKPRNALKAIYEAAMLGKDI